MEFKKFLESTVAQIEQERQRQLQVVREKVMREQVVPHNQEIDKARQDAEILLTDKYNDAVAELQAKYQIDKKALFEAGEKKKTDFMEATLASASYQINSECDKVIEKLKKQIDDLKE